MSTRALEIARSAIFARQAEIELIGHNIANAQTPGYSRRVAKLAAVPGETAARGIGLGVVVTDIQRLGDRLLATQTNIETGNLGRESVLADALAEVEATVAGSTGRGLLDPLNALFDAFSNVAADPAASTPRHQLVSAADSLCDAMRRTDSVLRTALNSNDGQVVTTVAQVNQFAREVAGLNAQIGAAGGAEQALDLVERRDVLVTELGRLAGATGIVRDNGHTDVLLGGHFLVQGDQTWALEIQLVAHPVSGYPPYHQVTFRGATPPDGLGGELAGHLEARENAIKGSLIAINNFAASLAAAINAQHGLGFDLDGAPGEPLLGYDPLDPNNAAQVIDLNPNIRADPRKLAAASRPDEVGNGENATALEALRTSSATLEAHVNLLGALGSDVQLAQSRRDARQMVVDALDARYQELAGVSVDEEALRLMEAEKAYAAAQRVAQIALAMVDEALRLVE